MSEDKKTIRQKIIEATFECIENEGIHAVTNRSIAKQADVNSAAINYYFGSKDNLIEETLKISLDNAFADPLFEQAEINSYENMYQVLRMVLLEHFNGMIQYPGISKAHLYNPFIISDYSGDAVHKLNEFMNVLYEKIKPFVPELSDDVKLSLLQLYSALFLVGIMPDLFKEFYDIDFTNSEQVERFVDHLLKHYFRKG